MKNCEIDLSISERGVTGVKIHADDANQQCSAHILLAAVAPEIRRLDEALKRVGQAPVAG